MTATAPEARGSGTRLVLVFAMVAAAAFVVLRVYGERFAAFRAASTPAAAAREFVSGDNTVVGRLGGIRDFAVIEVRPLSPGGDTVALSAEIVGRAGGGVLDADLARAGPGWHVLRANFVSPNGERLPLRVSAPDSAR